MVVAWWGSPAVLALMEGIWQGAFEAAASQTPPKESTRACGAGKRDPRGLERFVVI